MRLFEKYLVPSKPVFSPDTLHMVIEGKDPNVSAFKGIFQSFSDSPNGFKGEMQEIIHKLGLEARIESSDIFYVALRYGQMFNHIYSSKPKEFGLGIGAYGFALDMSMLRTKEADFFTDKSYCISLGFRYNLLERKLWF